MKIIIGVDFGDVRTGLAVSDATGAFAFPLHTFEAKGLAKAAQNIIDAAKEKNAESIVIGLPKNMDGTEGSRAKRCRDLKDELLKSFDGEIVMCDERLSTMQAANALNVTNTRGKKRKAVIDTVSAVIILQSYLDGLKNKK